MPKEDSKPTTSNNEENLKKKWKCTLVSFWCLGLCNNLGYVVMLSAAHDILEDFDNYQKANATYERDCNTLSTGVVLLADIVPSILIKMLAPFLPLAIQFRMSFVIMMSGIGFLLVGLRLSHWSVLLGVAVTSLSSGLGETTLLGYTVFFKTYNVISTWSSGTGGAGIFGAGIYLLLTSVIKLSPATSILVMLVIPIFQAITFFIFIEHPNLQEQPNSSTHLDALSLKNKFKLLPNLLKNYMLPFGLVYFFEYFINQGLFELLFFPKTFLNHSNQYRTYQFLYQTGVFISRSSMNIVQIDYLWIMAGFQFINVVFLLFEVYYGFVKYLIIMFFLILWEGLLGGASYVNTYRRIALESPPDEKQFCMSMNGLADAIMITLAGVVAAPVHEVLCNLEKTYEY